MCVCIEQLIYLYAKVCVYVCMYRAAHPPLRQGVRVCVYVRACAYVHVCVHVCVHGVGLWTNSTELLFGGSYCG